MLSILSNSEQINFFIVTSRKNIALENKIRLADNIHEYCEYYNINIDGIFYDIENKKELLLILKPICHFEDHVKTICECIDASIPIFCPGEILSKKHFNLWKNALDILNETKYYRKEVIDQKEKIVTNINNLIYNGGNI